MIRQTIRVLFLALLLVTVSDAQTNVRRLTTVDALRQYPGFYHLQNVLVRGELATEGMTMLIVSHEMGFAAHVASTAIFKDDGRIVERGPPAKLFAAPGSDRLRYFLNTWRERSI